jgi:hypothetical protein
MGLLNLRVTRMWERSGARWQGVNDSDLNSNVGQDTGYPDRRFSRLSSVRPREPRDITLNYVAKAVLHIISKPLLSVNSMPFN